jgi:tetratricopeptide (TPR) repeat protein
MALLSQDRHAEAEKVYGETLADIRKVLAANASLPPPLNSGPLTRLFTEAVASLLNDLGVLYLDTQRPKPAITAFSESLDLRRRLAREDPEKYDLHVLGTLSNLCSVVQDADQLSEAEATCSEAVAKSRELMKTKPEQYAQIFSVSIMNLGSTYAAQRRPHEAQSAFLDAVNKMREMVPSGSAGSAEQNQRLAAALVNLARCYIESGRHTDADKVLIEARAIGERLTEHSRTKYLSISADVWVARAKLYAAKKEIGREESSYREAIAAGRELTSVNAPKFWPQLAASLRSLGLLYYETRRMNEASIMFSESLDIYKKLAELDVIRYGDEVSNALIRTALVTDKARECTPVLHCEGGCSRCSFK